MSIKVCVCVCVCLGDSVSAWEYVSDCVCLCARETLGHVSVSKRVRVSVCPCEGCCACEDVRAVFLSLSFSSRIWNP